MYQELRQPCITLPFHVPHVFKLSTSFQVSYFQFNTESFSLLEPLTVQQYSFQSCIQTGHSRYMLCMSSMCAWPNKCLCARFLSSVFSRYLLLHFYSQALEEVSSVGSSFRAAQPYLWLDDFSCCSFSEYSYVYLQRSSSLSLENNSLFPSCKSICR